MATYDENLEQRAAAAEQAPAVDPAQAAAVYGSYAERLRRSAIGALSGGLRGAVGAFNEPKPQQQPGQGGAGGGADGVAQVEVPMAEAPVEIREGERVPGSPGGFDFSQYNAPPGMLEFAEQSNAPGWMDQYMAREGLADEKQQLQFASDGKQNVKDTLSGQANLAFEQARNREAEANENANLLEYAADVQRSQGFLEAQLARESEFRRANIDKMIADREKMVGEMFRKHKSPAKFFHPATGGATGILGAIAGISWALASPEYQKNTIAMANSLAEQEYRNRMADREDMQGRIRSVDDTLAAHERAYGRSKLAAESFKAQAREYTANMIENMAMRQQSDQMRRKGLEVAHLIRQGSREKIQKEIAGFQRPATPGSTRPVFNIGKEGKPTTINLPGGGVGMVKQESELILVPYGDKVIGLEVGGGPEQKAQHENIAKGASAANEMRRGAALLRAAAKEQDKTKKQALIEQATQAALPAVGAGTVMAQTGAPSGEEGKILHGLVTNNLKDLRSPSGRYMAEAGAWVKGVAGVDKRDPLEKSAEALESFADMTMRGVETGLRGRTVYGKLAEKDSSGNIRAYGWVPLNQAVTGPKGEGVEPSKTLVNPKQVKKGK